MFEDLRKFFRENPRMWVVVTLAVLLTVGTVWWVFGGFGFQIGQFFAAQLPPPATLSVQCTPTQAVLSWNIPAGSTTNAIQKNINGQGWQFINDDPTPFTQTTLTDTFTPTTVYRHKSDPNVVSNLVQCPPTASPTPSGAPSATPLVAINPISDPLRTALGTVSGTASDDVGVTSVKIVLRRGPAGALNSAANPDWNGTSFVDNGGTRVELNPVGTTNWSYSQTPPTDKMTDGAVYTLYAYSTDTHNQNSGVGATYRSFTYRAPTPSGGPSATPTVVINPIPDPLRTALGTVSGTASDDVGVASVKVVLRRGPPGPLNSATNPDWNGTDFVDNGGTRVELSAIGTTNWSYSQTPPITKMTDGAVYTLYAYSTDTHNQNSGIGVTYRSFTYRATTPTASPTTSTTPTLTPPPPSGCFYQDIQCVTTPCNPVLVCPSLTPTPLPQNALSMNVAGANISTDPATYSSVVSVNSNHDVAIRIVLANGTGNDSSSASGVRIANINLKVTMPQGLVYTQGSTRLNGTPLASDTVTTGGVTVGSLEAGESVTVDFRLRINGAVFPQGQTQARVTVQTQAEGGVSASDAVTLIVQKVGTGQPGTVPTGPGDAVIAALLISGILTLLYVSYTHTSVFRRREVETITRGRDPLDFRS
jgi:hypothetical protein